MMAKSLDQVTPIVLTKRQSQCAEHLLQGKTAKEIASVLQLSSRTIEYYIDNIKAKLNCKNRTELILAVACLLQRE
jgi:DNA-binding CsgD family transcriptional regulator